MEKVRTYLAVDLKSFYASVECVFRGLDPLSARLVVADKSRTNKTICLAVSPALKQYGIPGRARLFEVEQKVRDIESRTGETIDYIVAPPRMASYIEISAEIYRIYLQYVSAEDIHVYSIDECFMDITDYLRLYRMTAHELAGKIIRSVLEQTGITATAGIGSNLYLCKIAMDIVAKHVPADRDGVRIAELDTLDYRRLLWNHRPLTDFWQIGRGISNRLEKNGIYTMGDIARVSLYNEDILYKMFGINAEILIDHAWGYEPCTMKDIKNYKPDSNSISSGQVLKCPYDMKKTRLVVREMADQLVFDLVEKEMVTDSLTLTIGYDSSSLELTGYNGPVKCDFYGRLVPKPAHGTVRLDEKTNRAEKIMQAVLQLFDRIVSPELLARRITIAANRISSREYEQLNLFADFRAQEKERRLQEAVLSIRSRYGNNALLKGNSLEDGATARERNRQIGGHKA